MKKYFWILMALVPFLTSCIDNYVEPLVFGSNAWLGYEPAYVARELGYLKPDQVHLAEFVDATEVMHAFSNGQLDVAGLTLDEALVLRKSVPDLRIFMVADVSNGADVLMARRDIKNLGQLKGKRIGLEKTALGAYYLGMILHAANLAETDVRIVSLPLGEHVQAFNAGSVDAVVTFEPVRSELLRQGAHVLFDSTKVPGKIVDVLAVRKAVAEVQREHLHALVAAWFRALNVINHDHELAYPIMARHEQVSVSQLEQAMHGLSLVDRRQNLDQLSGNPSLLLKSAGDIQRILKETGLAAGSDDLSLLVDQHFVSGAEID